MSKPLPVSIGQIFDRWTVIKGPIKRSSASRLYYYKCRCVCGYTSDVGSHALVHGLSKSCGCLTREAFVERLYTHGRSKTLEHVSWASMKSRCSNKNFDCYKKYGARGIRVCKRWTKFENFYADMGPRPSVDHSLDRVDNSGDYEPGNCRWATREQQARNRRSNINISAFGETLCLSEWCRRLGVSFFMARKRIKQGMEPILALTKPSTRKTK